MREPEDYCPICGQYTCGSPYHRCDPARIARQRRQDRRKRRLERRQAIPTLSDKLAYGFAMLRGEV
jgi:hypothetical protein